MIDCDVNGTCRCGVSSSTVLSVSAKPPSESRTTLSVVAHFSAPPYLPRISFPPHTSLTFLPHLFCARCGYFVPAPLLSVPSPTPPALNRTRTPNTRAILAELVAASSGIRRSPMLSRREAIEGRVLVLGGGGVGDVQELGGRECVVVVESRVKGARWR